MDKAHRILENEIDPSENEIIVEDQKHHILLRLSVKQIVTLILTFSFVIALIFLVFFADKKSFYEAHPIVASIVDFNILIYIAIGFAAQMVDGALGMAYGATSQSLLGSAGVIPALSIQSIKLSEVFTTAASGYSHWKLGNVNRKLVKSLIIPGIIGSALGSIILVYLSHLEQFSKLYLKPAISLYVLLLGVYLIIKALKGVSRKKTTKLVPLATFGGFMDAIGGGGWGPIVTSTLLSKGRNPKYTIGSVNLSEFFVALVGAITLTWAVGLEGWKITLGMILGGVVAAPFGAIVAGKVKAKPLMVLVGSLIIIVNVYQLSKAYKAIEKEHFKTEQSK